MRFHNLCAATILLAMTAPASADPVADRTIAMANAWAHIKYMTPADNQPDAMTRLKGQADAAVAAAPGRAEPLIWDGIITSTLAGYALG